MDQRELDVSMDQRELADRIAPLVDPMAYTIDRWLVPTDHVRAAYGDKAATEYTRLLEEEMRLHKEGRYGEQVLKNAGCEPPYEVSVPKSYPWIKIPPLK